MIDILKLYLIMEIWNLQNTIYLNIDMNLLNHIIEYFIDFAYFFRFDIYNDFRLYRKYLIMRNLCTGIESDFFSNILYFIFISILITMISFHYIDII